MTHELFLWVRFMSTDFKLLDGIAAFVEVVSSGSFTNAANNSGHSTSYISKEITKLEKRLGVRLLNRTTRSIGLTAEGEAYYQQCCQIIEDAKSAELLMGGQQAEPQGVLRISCPTSIGLSRLSEVLPKFHELYPKIELEVDLSDHKVDLISEGFDLVIRASEKLDDSSLISRRFASFSAVTIASPAYLKKYGTPSHPREMVDHKAISYSNVKPTDVWHYIDEDGEQKSVPVKNSLVTNNSSLELAYCLAGKGITRLPLFCLSNEIQEGRLVTLFTDLPSKNIDVFLVYPTRKHLSSKVRAFIDFIVDELGD